MSEYPVVSATSATLRALLLQHFMDSGDPMLAGVDVFLESPRHLRDQDEPPVGVSLWMYRVTRNEFLLNRPAAPTGESTFPHQPLPLDLHYLVTPLAEDPGDEQDILARVLQTLNDHAVVRGADLRDELGGTGHELRVTLDSLSLEDLTRVWNALQEPYSLSVPYLVSVVSVDSAHEPRQGSRVERVEATYAQVVGRR